MSAGQFPHLLPRDVDAYALPEDQLHVGRVAQLHHGAQRQVDPLLRGRRSAELGTLVDGGVPGRLQLHLDQSGGQVSRKREGRCQI